ncbi:MAG: hypothetical protein A7316_02245 [Candidatus Altiarchaeales archaeon WOR_SM1_86-2]|nr:MAG: hypothetical protein A7316_02245 [Candidatus Altiarchaeales archaeon WOR_SM1_86-2]
MMEFDITREVIVKSESETDLDFGCGPEKRPIEKHIDSGAVNLDKPSGPASHQTSARVRGILQRFILIDIPIKIKGRCERRILLK